MILRLSGILIATTIVFNSGPAAAAGTASVDICAMKTTYEDAIDPTFLATARAGIGATAEHLEELWHQRKAAAGAHASNCVPLPTRTESMKRTPALEREHDIRLTVTEQTADGQSVPMKICDAIDHVTFKVESAELHKWTPVPTECESHEVFVHLDALPQITSNSRVEIDVFLKGSTTVVSRNFLWYRPWEGYSIGGGTQTWVWLPVGIFATNGKAGVDGIPFGIAPITIAVGEKYNFRRSRNYIGASLLVGWVWNGNRAGKPVPDTTAGERVFLSDGMFGGIVDFAGWLYGGVAYVKSFRKELSSEGVLLVGIGPRLLEILK